MEGGHLIGVGGLIEVHQEFSQNLVEMSIYSITNMLEGLWLLTHIKTTYHSFPDSLVMNTQVLFFYHSRLIA